MTWGSHFYSLGKHGSFRTLGFVSLAVTVIWESCSPDCDIQEMVRKFKALLSLRAKAWLRLDLAAGG